MSDSDSELLTNNLFTFGNESTMISARGPNIKAYNIPGISFHNTNNQIQMPRNFEQQRSESNYDQRRMYNYRRETSPMSIMSACDARQRNFNNSYNPRGMSSQGSMVHGRSQSPMSMRSIDSSASVSAADIAMAFKSMNFNKYDLRLIKDAYNKFMKHRVRKKIEKRRNLKLFLKGSRRRSGGDSGEQGSDSSLSSDDRSNRTSNYKENMSSCRSTKTDISEFRRTIKESNMYKDCTNNFKHNSYQSITRPVNFNTTQSSVSSHRSMIAGSSMHSFRSMPAPANFHNMQSKPFVPAMPLKERFTSGFLLPSQRFNKSVASTTIQENDENVNQRERDYLQNRKDSTMNAYKHTANNVETDSDLDDIFSETTTKQKINNTIQRKRSVDSEDDICLPNQKRTKVASPCKNSIEARKPMPKDTSEKPITNNTKNDFVFAKPTFPVRKSAKEKLISKSAALLTDTLTVAPAAAPVNKPHSEKPAQENEREHEDEQSNTSQNTTDLSMRPSFIKRKLFTQKLDLAEKKNMSTDGSDSPQGSIYSGNIQKEKHRARKLQQVTTQSCLSRDILGDESNLIDLIHKIVPMEQMNMTSQTNKTDLQSSKNKSEEDKFDVTSIITERKDDEDLSDTYTDEEIFNATVKAASKIRTSSPKKDVAVENVSKKPSPKEKDCKILVERIPAIILQRNLDISTKNDVARQTVPKCIKTFWDTDFESDAECLPPPKNGKLKDNHSKEILQQKEPSAFQGFSNMFNSKKSSSASVANASTFLNDTVNSVQNFNNITLRIRSHRTPKRKKLDQTRDDDAKSAMFEPQSKKQKTFQARSCIELSKTLNSKQQTDSQVKKTKETASKQITKQDNKKSPKSRKAEPKTNKNIATTASNIELPTKKPSNSSKNQEKTYKSEMKTNNNKKDDVQSEQKTKQESKRKKTTLSPLKNNNANQDDTPSGVRSKAETNNNKLTQSNSKQKTNTKIQDKIDSVKVKKEKNKVIPPKTDTTKKPELAKSQTKKPRPKTKKTLQNESIVYGDTTIEENNNTSNRAVRLCRRSKQNETLDKTDLALNETLTRSLRTRQIDLSSTLNGNITKTKQKNKPKDAKSRLSDVSFSLTAGKTATAKKAVTKLNNSRLFKTNDVETSDISFSLTAIKSPTPKKTISARSRVNSKAGKKHNELIKSTPSKRNDKVLFVSKNECKSSRNRIPNKRYLIC